MTTTSDTFTHEHVTIHTAPAETTRSEPIQRTHFTRMGGIYAWALVTLAIFFLAAMLAGMEDNRVAADSDVPRLESVSAVHAER